MTLRVERRRACRGDLRCSSCGATKALFQCHIRKQELRSPHQSVERKVALADPVVAHVVAAGQAHDDTHLQGKQRKIEKKKLVPSALLGFSGSAECSRTSKRHQLPHWGSTHLRWAVLCEEGVARTACSATALGEYAGTRTTRIPCFLQAGMSMRSSVRKTIGNVAWRPVKEGLLRP